MNINNVMPADQGSLNQVISRQLGKSKLQVRVVQRVVACHWGLELLGLRFQNLSTCDIGQNRTGSIAVCRRSRYKRAFALQEKSPLIKSIRCSAIKLDRYAERSETTLLQGPPSIDNDADGQERILEWVLLPVFPVSLWSAKS